jgi:hypothetical protein
MDYSAVSPKDFELGLGGCVSSNSVSFASASVSRMMRIRPPHITHSLHFDLKQSEASLIIVAEPVATNATQKTSLNISIGGDN